MANAGPHSQEDSGGGGDGRMQFHLRSPTPPGPQLPRGVSGMLERPEPEGVSPSQALGGGRATLGRGMWFQNFIPATPVLPLVPLTCRPPQHAPNLLKSCS